MVLEGEKMGLNAALFNYAALFMISSQVTNFLVFGVLYDLIATIATSF